MIFYKYHGAGNDFLIADNRDGSYRLPTKRIVALCDRHTGIGADGLILLEESPENAFRMKFFNPDGSGGMMCGNGGRCIVAFAVKLGIVDAGRWFTFDAPDGPHRAICLNDGNVRLGMRPVRGMREYSDGIFIDTGTRHFVKFVDNLGSCDVAVQGPILRHDSRFAPQGTNVDFVSPAGPGCIRIRTFEKGVEAETLACGTGIVAAALAAYSRNIPPASETGPTAACMDKFPDSHVSYWVRAAIADLLVDFTPQGSGRGFRATDIFLTGPATYVGLMEI